MVLLLLVVIGGSWPCWRACLDSCVGDCFAVTGVNWQLLAISACACLNSYVGDGFDVTGGYGRLLTIIGGWQLVLPMLLQLL